MLFNISSDNLKFCKTSVPFTDELKHYYCILRVYDNELAKENCLGDSKSLVFVNHPILFKTDDEATLYLLSKVPMKKLPLYVVTMLCNVKSNYSTFIIGSYSPIDE